MYSREAEKTIRYLSGLYPVVAITGPRQSGKTTLVQAIFKDKKYVSLEDPDQNQFAREDPRTFLTQSSKGLVIDEIQRRPELFSYIQGIVDSHKKMGEFIITGSQQFGLVSQITQSLAGRAGLLELLPFSFLEIKHDLDNLDEVLYKGFYPPLYDRPFRPRIWHEDYIKTYIERDVRNLVNVKDLSAFQKFLLLCAARVGQLVNHTKLSNDADVDVRTVKSWLSVLESSYIIFLLRPHFKNFSKKLVKSPKLYFYDSGLLCYLLGIGKEGLPLSPYRGAIFESMIISECLKYNKNFRNGVNFYFWRDNKGVEINLLYEIDGEIFPMEIKSGKTLQSNFFKNLQLYRKYAGNLCRECFLIYGGDEAQTRQSCHIIPWKYLRDIQKIVGKRP